MDNDRTDRIISLLKESIHKIDLIDSNIEEILTAINQETKKEQ